MLLLLYGILVLVTILDFFLFNGKKALHYRNWYRPWLATLFIFVVIIYKPELYKIIRTYFPNITNGISLIFVIGVYIIWIILKSFLSLFHINDALEEILKKHNTNKLIEIRKGFANYLIWPYFISDFEIYYKSGYDYFKKLFVGGLILIFIVYFVSIYINDPKSIFYIPTALGLLLGIIFIEWIIYFICPIAKMEVFISKKKKELPNVSFYDLFNRYIDKEFGFYDSLIFGYIDTNTLDIKKEKENISKYINKYLDEFRSKDNDFIVASNDFLDTIPQFSDIFFDTLKVGGNILILADIPDHVKFNPKEVGIFFKNKEKEENIAELFGEYLERTIEHLNPSARGFIKIGYYDKVNIAALNNRIVLTNIGNALDESLIHSNWIKELDLIVVVQFNDSYANNLLEKRKLSLCLKQQNIDYKTVLFKIYRSSGDEALTNTWMTIVNPMEAKIDNPLVAYQSYFINFAFEKSQSNLNKIFKGLSYQFDYSPGIELSIFAIMEHVNHIHYFEGYHLDYVQSKNNLEKAQVSLLNYLPNPDQKDKNYREIVTQEKLKDSIKINNLPFIIRELKNHPYCQEQHLAVIYDIENNAPKLYQKYKHLGKEDAFICIVSKPHLFREFFAFQMGYFIDVTLEALEPQLSKANINLCLQIFNLMRYEKVSIDYINYLINLHAIDISGKSVIDFVSELFKRYLHLDSSTNPILKSHYSIVYEKGRYLEIKSLSVDEQELNINNVFEYLKEVKIVDNSRNLLLSIPKYLLFQNILPQQIIVINGSSFQFNHFDLDKNELVLNAIPSYKQTFYKPVAKIEFSEEVPISIDNKKIRNFNVKRKYYEFSSEILEKTIEISFDRYYVFKNEYHSPFANSNQSQFVDLKKDKEFQNISTRKFITRYLKIQWELIDNFKKDKDVLTTRMHHLLYEFMLVLFPYRYQYIQILSDNNMDVEHRNLVPWIFPSHNLKLGEDDKIDIYIIEDSFSDLGILKSIQSHLEYIIKNLYDLLLWLNDNKECFNSNYSQYVKGETFFLDRLKFLKYGLSDKEISWDLNLLINFIKENSFFNNSGLDNNYNSRCQQIDLSIEVECDYCRQKFKLSEVEVMEDGLHRCAACSEGAIDTIEQVKELEQEAVKLYKEILNIDVSQNNLPYKLLFLTATEMHKYYGKKFFVTNKYDKREIIGLASDRETDIIRIEKFRKKPETLSVIVHEIMHIIQYQKLNYFKIKNNENLLIEGMTTWVEYYILAKSGVPDYIKESEAHKDYLLHDNTKYGKGFRYVQDKYGEKKFMKIFQKYKISDL